MNIIYTIDNGFYYQLYVSIKSMILNSTGDFNIYIVIDRLDNDKKQQLNKLSDFTKYNIRIIFLSPIYLNYLKLKNDRGSVSQYYRLFLDKIFQYNDIDINSVGKLLYLDADTMMVNDIQDILNTDLGKYSLGACLDAWSPYYRKLFNLDKNTPMLNSGVLLIDLIKWKKNNISNRIIQLIQNRKGFFNQGDQGILNELFMGNFKIIPMKYNLNSVSIEFQYDEINSYRKPISFYDYHEYEQSKRNPTIIHFISSFLMDRPWKYQVNSYYGNLWRKYCLSVKEFNNFSKRRGILFYLYNKLNRKFAIYLLGILQAYVRPFILKINNLLKKLINI